METGFITEVDRYLFGEGTHYEIYKKLGAHLAEYQGQKGVYFAVWAPKAKNVSVVGDFNGWMGYNHNMERLGDSGIYELFVPGIGEGELYKYAIVTQAGQTIMKCDPYGNYSELRPNNASIVTDITGFEWTDKKWKHRSNPMAIYEVHIGSWKKTADLENGGFYNYVDMAHELGAYVKEMGYTHVELIGIAEHPFDGSWGYQVTGYYAPTSRYGTPKDFMYFVNYMHNLGIGVILDWVPAHFPRDSHGLANFDGTCVYEYADSRKGEHPDWGTKIFDYAKHEVSDFLIANALYWLKEYHVDGLRVDAVASMLYLDYGKTPGNWVPNIYGGHENLEAIEFFRHLNSVIKRQVPDAIVIAEESTAWPSVTKTPEEGGLGFEYKWNMGWMNDVLNFYQMDPLFRGDHLDMLTFSWMYRLSENYILPLSHDEVVHGKKSLLHKMWGGDRYKQFAQLRNLLTYQITHPGKKLLFMGGEFGQFIEWRYYEGLTWDGLDDELNKKMQHFTAKLNEFYREHRALWELEDKEESLEVIDANNKTATILSFIRHGKRKKDFLVVVMNLTTIEQQNFEIGVPYPGSYREVWNTEMEEFGGTWTKHNPLAKTKEKGFKNYDQVISLTVPALGVVILNPEDVNLRYVNKKYLESKKAKKVKAKTVAKKQKQQAKEGKGQQEKRPKK